MASVSIARDVKRVAPVAIGHVDEIEALLMKVCQEFPNIGYTQGMNEVLEPTNIISYLSDRKDVVDDNCIVIADRCIPLFSNNRNRRGTLHLL